MQLKPSGTIKMGEYLARFTTSGEWSITRHGKFIGSAPTLGEIDTVIDANLVVVRARLRLAQDRAQSQKETE